MRQVQEDWLALHEQTRHCRVYLSNVPPGFLQTPAFATALMGCRSPMPRRRILWPRLWSCPTSFRSRWLKNAVSMRLQVVYYWASIVL